MGRLMLLALVVGGAGCGHLLGLTGPLDGDSGVIGNFCYGKGLVRVCFSEMPQGDQTLDTTVDTAFFGCNQKVISGGDGVCVIGAKTWTVPSGATSLVTNPTGMSIPLVLVATDSITIAGTLDASGGHQGTTPAGSGFSGCLAGTNPVTGTTDGGGQGGSFTAKGGDGGAGGSSAGGIAGAALPAPTALHGGCPGHSSSGGSFSSKGGGAVYLIADQQAISITGRLDASGGGGAGVNEQSGGGGGAGGSGGMIGLDAPTLMMSGAVCAIGGSGAAGAPVGGQPSSSSGGSATGGSTACTPGTPGHGQSNAGDGGAGGTSGAGAPGTPGAVSGGGGGGGGGSSGYIKTYGTVSGGGTIVPPPS